MSTSSSTEETSSEYIEKVAGEDLTRFRDRVREILLLVNPNVRTQIADALTGLTCNALNAHEKAWGSGSNLPLAQKSWVLGQTQSVLADLQRTNTASPKTLGT